MGRNVCTTDQSTRTRCVYVNGPILWIVCKGPICCMYKETILWGYDSRYKESDSCTEDQSYGTVHVVTRTYVRSSEGLIYTM